MGYIVHKGKVAHAEDFDLLEEYAAANKTKVTQVELWSFERLPIGQVCVHWKNGAIGHFVAGDLRVLRTYIESLDGWPKPTTYSRGLPYAGGALWVSDTNTDSGEGEKHVTKRVVRERHTEVVGRVRRTRANV